MKLNQKQRKISFVTGIFLLGIVLGVLLGNVLFSRAIEPLYKVIRVSLAVEENLKARRLERKGDILGALAHQKNAVLFYSKKHINALTPSENGIDSMFAYLILGEIYPSDVGENNVEALERARLAYLLEKSGAVREAQLEWKAAAQLMGHNNVERVKSIIEYLKKNSDEDLMIEVENTYLGKE